MLLWEGASLINGKPIVAIATVKSSNEKTGDMIQTWILPRDMAPHNAVKTGEDDSVCGDCPHRHYSGGACYVLPFQGPRSVWAAWQRGSYETDRHRRAFDKARGRKMVRLGAYGDPAAVPARVWSALVHDAPGWTGYTHQWQKPFAADLRGLCMASVDSASEARQAAAMGWRYFRVLGPADAPESLAGAVECLSDSRGLTCAECRVCNGARVGRSKQPTSIWIDVHGARSGRFTSKRAVKPSGLAVVQ